MRSTFNRVRDDRVNAREGKPQRNDRQGNEDSGGNADRNAIGLAQCLETFDSWGRKQGIDACCNLRNFAREIFIVAVRTNRDLPAKPNLRGRTLRYILASTGSAVPRNARDDINAALEHGLDIARPWFDTLTMTLTLRYGKKIVS